MGASTAGGAVAVGAVGTATGAQELVSQNISEK